MKCPTVAVIALVALALAQAADNDEWKPCDAEILRQVHEDCSRESGLSPRQIEAILRKERPDEEEVHAYVLCAVKTIGVFNEETGYILDRVMAQFDVLFYGVERVRHMVADCIDSNEEKSSPAVWAYRGQKCMLNSKLAPLLRAGARNP